MKYKLSVILIIFIISALFSSVSCNTPPADTPVYTNEQVLEIAKSVSPDCRLPIVADGGSG